MQGSTRLEEIRAALASETKPAVAPASDNAAIENTATPASPTVNTTKQTQSDEA
jgi:hypothetical protein